MRQYPQQQQHVPSRLSRAGAEATAAEGGGLNSLSSSLSSTSSFGSSMGIISPKSPPPGSLDLYGKRRQLVKVQLLEKEIGILQDELKSIDNLQAASGCVKELDNFLRAKPDPLVALNEEASKSDHWWKRFQSKFCCNVTTNGCCFSCGTCQNISQCCRCCSKKKKTCRSCSSKCCYGNCSGCSCAGCASNWCCCLRLPSCCCGSENSRSCCCNGGKTSFSCSCSCSCL